MPTVKSLGRGTGKGQGISSHDSFSLWIYFGPRHCALSEIEEKHYAKLNQSKDISNNFLSKTFT